MNMHEGEELVLCETSTSLYVTQLNHATLTVS